MKAFLVQNNDEVTAIHAADITEAIKQVNELYPVEMPSLNAGYYYEDARTDEYKVVDWYQRSVSVVGTIKRLCETGVSVTMVSELLDEDAHNNTLLNTLSDVEHQIQFCLALDKTELASEILGEIDDVVDQNYLAWKYDLPEPEESAQWAEREHKAYLGGMPVHVGW